MFLVFLYEIFLYFLSDDTSSTASTSQRVCHGKLSISNILAFSLYQFLSQAPFLLLFLCLCWVPFFLCSFVSHFHSLFCLKRLLKTLFTSSSSSGKAQCWFCEKNGFIKKSFKVSVGPETISNSNSQTQLCFFINKFTFINIKASRLYAAWSIKTNIAGL